MAKAVKLPSGRWRCRAYVGIVNGKKKYKSITADSKREAERQAAILAYEMHDTKTGDYERLTLREAMTGYVDSVTGVIADTTEAKRRSAIRCLPSWLGDKYVGEVDGKVLQRFVTEQLREFSRSTVKDRVECVRLAVKWATGKQLSCQFPTRAKEEVYIPDEKLIRRIARAVAGTELELPFRLASECGLRESEIAGLEKRDVRTRYIDIKRARVSIGTREITKSPKTYTSARSVPVTDDLREALLAVDGERICPLRANAISSKWRYFLRRNGIEPFRFHLLRHYYCSFLIASGIPTAYIAKLLGHYGTAMVDAVYGHIMQDKMDEFADAVRTKMTQR